MNTLSLSRLNEFIRRAVTANFLEAVWITAEVIQAKLNRGHYYIDLVEKNNDEVIAQSSAVIWKSDLITIQRYNPANLELILKEGNEIRVQVLVDYNIRYGLKLIIQNIDSSYTLGKIAQNRIEIIQRLQEEKLWQRNKLQKLPSVIKKIAVISSLSSAGKKDFEDELLNNEWQYQFSVVYYQASMQGENSEKEIAKAFEEIDKSLNTFDLICIIRGGGSKLDLLNFDSYLIAKYISVSTLPVITGIGHLIDESIADLSAFQSLKTPTATANFILQHNIKFEIQIDSLLQKLNNSLRYFIQTEKNYLEQLNLSLIQRKEIQLLQKEKEITKSENLIKNLAKAQIQKSEIRLLAFEKINYSLDPTIALQNGFVLVEQAGLRIKRKNQLNLSEGIGILFQDGKVEITK